MNPKLSDERYHNDSDSESDEEVPESLFRLLLTEENACFASLYHVSRRFLSDSPHQSTLKTTGREL